MSDSLDVYSIYEQNLNFLFGAGASFGFLPTLALKIKDQEGNTFTFETLAKVLDDGKHEKLYALLFMYYYKKCIHTGLPRNPSPPFPPDRVAVLDQYKAFLKTLVRVLEKQDASSRKCNIYTTNYDSCFEIASDDLMRDRSLRFSVNDGSSGFQYRSFHTRNFNNCVVQKGIFDKHAEPLPQINILHPHGSVYWKKNDDGIQVDYGDTDYDIDFGSEQTSTLSAFEALVEDPTKSIDDLLNFEMLELSAEFSVGSFWDEYKRIPIVNPTKWKFHETVFEEAYYQILRHLSFELERPNSVLITFGFSFADEHILSLVQRSLSNPSLTVFISCYNEAEKLAMQAKFSGEKNVKYLVLDEDLSFERFNNQVFTLNKDGK